MSITDVVVVLLALLAGAAVGWFTAGRRAARVVADGESRTTIDARLNAQTARAEASRAREEAAVARAETAHRLFEQATLRTAVADAEVHVQQERVATSRAMAEVAQAL